MTSSATSHTIHQFVWKYVARVGTSRMDLVSQTLAHTARVFRLMPVLRHGQ